MKIYHRFLAILLAFVLVCSPLLSPRAEAADTNTRAGYKTFDEAMEYIRQKMAQFQTSITLKFQFDSPYEYSEGALWDMMKPYITQHTGVPDEGDYLYWTFQTIGYDFTDEFDGTTHYVTVESIVPTYNNTAQQEKELEAKLEQVMAELDLDGKSDYEKIEAIYRYVCENVDYSEAALSGEFDPLLPPEDMKIYWSAYAALVLGETTCQGYSSLIYRMMLMAGIDCRLIAGDNHGWNIVKLDDKYYYLDATWDETVDGQPYNPQYFLSGSASFRIDGHKAWTDSYTPEFVAQYPISVLDYGVEEPSADAVLGSGKCGNNVKWKLTGDGKLVISGSGAMWNAAPSGVGWIEGNLSSRWDGLNGYIKSVEIQNGVTSVGDYAFYNCPQLAEISFAGTVTNLGKMSFSLCEGLKELTLPNTVRTVGIQAFYQCVNLETVTLSAGMKEIPEQMFIGCTGLKTVHIPEGIEKIGEAAFHTCPKLQMVNIPASVTTLGPGSFAGSFDPEAKVSLAIPETVQEVGWASFENTGLWEVIWNAQADVVEMAMFNLSFYLENVEFNDCATSFEEWVFHECFNLKTVRMPAPLTEVGDEIFLHCLSLEDIALPESLTNISRNMFSGCYSLPEIVIPETVTSIDVNGFAGCSSLKQIVVPAAVKEVGVYAFATGNDLLVVFMGDAPDLIGVEGPEQYAFSTMGEEYKVTIYYPEGNETWTWDKQHELADEYPRWKPMHSPDAAHTVVRGGSDADSHWNACSGCPEILDLQPHSYRADCDAYCSVCGRMRSASAHNYGSSWLKDENQHWQECADCGKTAYTKKHGFSTGVEEGSTMRYSCSTCGYEKVEEITPSPTEPATQPTNSPTTPNSTDAPEPTGSPNADTGDTNNNRFVVIGVIAAVIVGAVVVVIILKKKK